MAIGRILATESGGRYAYSARLTEVPNLRFRSPVQGFANRQGFAHPYHTQPVAWPGRNG